VLPKVLELPSLVVHLFPSLDIGPHIPFIIKQDNPLLIPPALQQLSAFPSALDGELVKQQDSWENTAGYFSGRRELTTPPGSAHGS
jgi:hypothetical protein